MRKIRLRQPRWVKKDELRRTLLDQFLMYWEMRRFILRDQKAMQTLVVLPENDEKWIAVWKKWHWVADDLPTLYEMMKADCVDSTSFTELLRIAYTAFNSSRPMVLASQGDAG